MPNGETYTTSVDSQILRLPGFHYNASHRIVPRICKSSVTDCVAARILHRMPAEPVEYPTIASVAASDVPAALELVFSRLDQEPRKLQLAAAIEEIGRSGNENQIFLAAHRHDQLVAAVWLQLQPGCVGSLWPPGVLAGESDTTAVTLIDLATAKAEAAGASLIQSLLETDSGREAAWLARCGFRNATDLLYLVSPREAFPAVQPAEELDFEPLVELSEPSGYNTARNSGDFSTAQTTRLAAIVERTYDGTLDCPAVQGLRSIDEVLASYRAVGVFDPSRWFIVRQCASKSDVGCLLLAEHPAQNHWELVYMGLVPEARGCGIGLEIVRHAQWLCGKSRAERLVLAVDAANVPAISAYAAAGFETWDRRSVYLRAKLLDDSTG
jgi:mycothiol synthase